MRQRPARQALTGVLIAFGSLALLFAAPIVTGLVSVVVTRGVSMNPVYYQGDLVVVAKSHSYRIGQIAAYNVPGNKIVALHRIIGEADGGFVMKGDNNESIDPTHPTPSLVIGRAALLIPHGDLWRRPPSSDRLPACSHPDSQPAGTRPGR